MTEFRCTLKPKLPTIFAIIHTRNDADYRGKKSKLTCLIHKIMKIGNRSKIKLCIDFKKIFLVGVLLVIPSDILVLWNILLCALLPCFVFSDNCQEHGKHDEIQKAYIKEHKLVEIMKNKGFIR